MRRGLLSCKCIAQMIGAIIHEGCHVLVLHMKGKSVLFVRAGRIRWAFHGKEGRHAAARRGSDWPPILLPLGPWPLSWQLSLWKYPRYSLMEWTPEAWTLSLFCDSLIPFTPLSGWTRWLHCPFQLYLSVFKVVGAGGKCPLPDPSFIWLWTWCHTLSADRLFLCFFKKAILPMIRLIIHASLLV